MDLAGRRLRGALLPWAVVTGPGGLDARRAPRALARERLSEEQLRKVGEGYSLGCGHLCEGGMKDGSRYWSSSDGASSFVVRLMSVGAQLSSSQGGRKALKSEPLFDVKRGGCSQIGRASCRERVSSPV